MDHLKDTRTRENENRADSTRHALERTTPKHAQHRRLCAICVSDRSIAVVYCSERRINSGARYHRVTTCLVMVREGSGADGSDDDAFCGLSCDGVVDELECPLAATGVLGRCDGVLDSELSV